MSDLKRLIEEEAEHAERHRDDPIPADVQPTRPGRAKSAMFSLRLNPDELAGIQRLAQESDVPASALVRGWIVQRLAAERNGPTEATGAVEQLEAVERMVHKVLVALRPSQTDDLWFEMEPHAAGQK